MKFYRSLHTNQETRLIAPKLKRTKLTERLELNFNPGLLATCPSVCFITTVSVPFLSAVAKIPRYAKLAVPPKSLSKDLHAKGPSLKESRTRMAVSSVVMIVAPMMVR